MALIPARQSGEPPDAADVMVVSFCRPHTTRPPCSLRYAASQPEAGVAGVKKKDFSGVVMSDVGI